MPLKNELARNTSTCLGIRGPTANVHDFSTYICMHTVFYQLCNSHSYYKFQVDRGAATNRDFNFEIAHNIYGFQP